MADGYLKIKTRLDNKEIDKDVAALENKMKKLQLDNKNASSEQKILESEINKYEELTKQAEEYRFTIRRLNQDRKNMLGANPNLAVSTTPELTSIDNQLSAVKKKYADIAKEIDKQAPKIDKVHIKLEKVKEKQVENNAKMTEFQQKIDQVNISKMEKGIDSVGKGIQKSIGKLGKMALAVFGIRTAFNAVRTVIDIVSQYNPQIAANIDYIKYALANTLLPIVEKLVNLVYTLLSYLNAISTAWFGINLFANSSAKSFQKMRSGATGTAKAAKEIKKSLQGFDEMNIMQDNSESSGGSSVGGISPSMDLSGIQGQVPEWLKWIIDNKDLILSVLAGIAAGVIALKLGLGGFKSLGIGVVIAGIVGLIQSLIDYLNDGSWESFGKIISSIGVILLGLSLIIGGIPLAVAGAIAFIIGIVVSNWEKIKSVLEGRS